MITLSRQKLLTINQIFNTLLKSVVANMIRNLINMKINSINLTSKTEKVAKKIEVKSKFKRQLSTINSKEKVIGIKSQVRFKPKIG